MSKAALIIARRLRRWLAPDDERELCRIYAACTEREGFEPLIRLRVGKRGERRKRQARGAGVPIKYRRDARDRGESALCTSMSPTELRLDSGFLSGPGHQRSPVLL
jgi:hypothetical protein